MYNQQSYGQQQQAPANQPPPYPHAYGQSLHYGGPPAPQKHSGLGVASLLLSIVSALLMFALFAVLAVMEARNPGTLDEDSPATMMIGLAFIAFIGMSVVALVLGLVAFAQRDRKHLCAILGIVFSALTVVAIIGLMILGAVAG